TPRLFKTTATPTISTLSLHDALPIFDHALKLQREYESNASPAERKRKGQFFTPPEVCRFMAGLFSPHSAGTFRLLDPGAGVGSRSEEHTSELQSRVDLVCRLLLEKKK